jgi:hypothetical protein
VNRNGLKGKTEAQVFSSLLSKVSVPSSFSLPIKWSGHTTCGGPKQGIRFSFRNKKVVAGNLRYALSININSNTYFGQAKIMGQTFQFETKNKYTGWVRKGSGRFNAQYNRANGTINGCAFELYSG